MRIMSKTNIIPLACGILSLILGLTGHAIPAGIFGLSGVVLALTIGDRDDD